MRKKTDNMKIVIDAARAAADIGEVPVAAAISDRNGNLITLAQNRMKRDANATHHAELLALQEAMKITGKSRLDGYDLWVSLEPCAMCAGAIAIARIRRLYFAATDTKGGAIESGIRLFESPTCHHKPDVYGGIQSAEAQQLLITFFAARR